MRLIPAALALLQGPEPRRSCGTCSWADTAVRDAGPVMECHLDPPSPQFDTTVPELPDAIYPTDPALETAWEELEDAHHDLEVIAEAVNIPRYPVVNETDWCSNYREVRA